MKPQILSVPVESADGQVKPGLLLREFHTPVLRAANFGVIAGYGLGVAITCRVHSVWTNPRQLQIVFN